MNQTPNAVNNDPLTPACELIDLHTGHRIEGSKRISALVADSLVMKRKIDRIRGQLQDNDARLIHSMLPGTEARIDGLGGVTRVQQPRVVINNRSRLQVVLAEVFPEKQNFDKFVNTCSASPPTRKTRWRPASGNASPSARPTF